MSPNEEFTTSLGADQSIRITVRPVSSVHNTRSALLGGAKTNCITFTHSFVVKNTRSDSVHIKVSEQVPLSTDERIKVCTVYVCSGSSMQLTLQKLVSMLMGEG